MIKIEIESINQQIENLKTEAKFLELLNELKQVFEELKTYEFKAYTTDKKIVDKHTNDHFITFYSIGYLYSVEASDIKSFLELYEIVYEKSHPKSDYLKIIIRKINKLNKYLSNSDITNKYSRLLD